MKSSEFRSLIAGGESGRLEFNSDRASLDSLAGTVCAFLNGSGGKLLIGVDGKGRPRQGSRVDALGRAIEASLGRSISPRASWTVERESVDGIDLLIVDVPEGHDKPYVFKGAIHLRRGASTVTASREEISSLIKARSSHEERWERRIAVGVDRADLDDKLIREALKRASQGRQWSDAKDDPDAFLSALGLLFEGSVTNAALVLFGKRPTRWLPQARVRLLVLPEGKGGDSYDLDRTFEGALLRAAEQVSSALQPYADGVASRFSAGDWRRHDRSLYPMTALREGVMNALVHRDYDSTGLVMIEISRASFTITNPGALPVELTPADLKREHPSVPRNPDIAHVCFLHGLIEKIGRGTQRIIEDCRAAGLREPKWKSTAHQTSLSLLVSATQGSSGAPALSERQERILSTLKKQPHLSAADLLAQLGAAVTDRTVRTDLQALLRGGWVERRGKGRATSYLLVKGARRT